MTVDIEKFSKTRVIVIGDLMIDEYLWGTVDRISPEAPVPIVSVERESYTLGGAGNVINNLVALGATVFPIGTAGTGKAGGMIFEQLEALGVETHGIIKEADRPTTRKTRVIASNQQVLRIDKETRKEISNDTLKKVSGLLKEKMPDLDLIIISDYDKGLVTRSLVKQTVDLARKHKILVIADPKGLDYSKYRHVNLLTPNRKEAAQSAGMQINSHDDLVKAGRLIIKKAGLERLLITCGKDGMVLFDSSGDPFEIASKAQQVFDVSGAGDTVIAILGLGLASGASFRESAMVANVAAGIVVAKLGTATASKEELKNALAL